MRSCDNFLFCLHLLVKEGDVLFTYVFIFRAALSLFACFRLLLVAARCCFVACAYLFYRNSFLCYFSLVVLVLSRQTLINDFEIVLVTVGCSFLRTCVFSEGLLLMLIPVRRFAPFGTNFG